MRGEAWSAHLGRKSLHGEPWQSRGAAEVPPGTQRCCASGSRKERPGQKLDYRCWAHSLSCTCDRRITIGPALCVGWKSRGDRVSCAREKHRGTSLREPERRQGQRLLRRWYPGRNSHALGEDRRSQGHFTHFHAALQERAG